MLDFALQFNMRLIVGGEPLSPKTKHYLWDVTVLLLCVIAWYLENYGSEDMAPLAWVIYVLAWLVHAKSWTHTLAVPPMPPQPYPQTGFGRRRARPTPILLSSPPCYSPEPSPSPTSSAFWPTPESFHEGGSSPSSVASGDISESILHSPDRRPATPSAVDAGTSPMTPSVVDVGTSPASPAFTPGTPPTPTTDISEASPSGLPLNDDLWGSLQDLPPLSPFLDTQPVSPDLPTPNSPVSSAGSSPEVDPPNLPPELPPPIHPDIPETHDFDFPPEAPSVSPSEVPSSLSSPSAPSQPEPIKSRPSPREDRIWETLKPLLPRFKSYGQECSFIPCPKITFLLDRPSTLSCRICRYTPLITPGSQATTHSEDATPCILPCGHIAGNACMNMWIQEHASCPFCRFDMSYPGCGHRIDPKLVTQDTVFTLPLTVPEGGSVPLNCHMCQQEKARVQTDEAYDKATAELNDIRKRWLMLGDDSWREEILAKKDALDTFAKEEICEW